MLLDVPGQRLQTLDEARVEHVVDGGGCFEEQCLAFFEPLRERVRDQQEHRELSR